MIGILQEFLGPTFIKSLGLTFVHSLWQATLIAGVLYLVLQGIPTQEASKRYVASSVGLIAGSIHDFHSEKKENPFCDTCSEKAPLLSIIIKSLV